MEEGREFGGSRPLAYLLSRVGIMTSWRMFEGKTFGMSGPVDEQCLHMLYKILEKWIESVSKNCALHILAAEEKHIVDMS